MGLGVPGLSVLSDRESPTLSEKEPDLFLAALMGTLRELLRDSKEDILTFTITGGAVLHNSGCRLSFEIKEHSLRLKRSSQVG